MVFKTTFSVAPCRINYSRCINYKRSKYLSQAVYSLLITNSSRSSPFSSGKSINFPSFSIIHSDTLFAINNLFSLFYRFILNTSFLRQNIILTKFSFLLIYHLFAGQERQHQQLQISKPGTKINSRMFILQNTQKTKMIYEPNQLSFLRLTTSS